MSEHEPFETPPGSYPEKMPLPKADSTLPEFQALGIDVLTYANRGRPDDLDKLKALTAEKVVKGIYQLRDTQNYPSFEWVESNSSKPLARYLEDSLFAPVGKKVGTEEADIAVASGLLLFLREIGFNNEEIRDGLESNKMTFSYRNSLNIASEQLKFGLDFGHFDE